MSPADTPADTWIPFDEGRYLVERAYLITADAGLALALADPVIEVNLGQRGNRYLMGMATIINHLFIRMLDESDAIDLILDFGGPYKYRLPRPQIRSGKVLSPDIPSTAQFIPTDPWVRLSETAFDACLAGLQLLGATG